MGEMRKITVEVPEAVLEKAQKFTGEGITKTVLEGLKELNSKMAQQKARTLRGKVKFSMSLEEMRYDRE